MNRENLKIKSPLRWAGGKGWLVKHIGQHLPEFFNDYYEPFLGGAAITLNLAHNKRLYNNIFLSDCNTRLIEFYQILKDKPHELSLKLQQYKNTKEYYYSEREKIYEETIDHLAPANSFLNTRSRSGSNSNSQNMTFCPRCIPSLKRINDVVLTIVTRQVINEVND